MSYRGRGGGRGGRGGGGGGRNFSVSTKLYVGNIPETCRRADLQKKFESYGNVVECDIVKNYGFVHYEIESEAKAAAAALDGTDFEGELLKVELSHSRVRHKPGMGGKLECYRCGDEGHWSKDCPKLGPSRPRAPPPPRSRDPYARDPYGADPYYRDRYPPPPVDRFRPYPDPYDRRPPPPRDPYYRSERDPYQRPPPEYYGRSREAYYDSYYERRSYPPPPGSRSPPRARVAPY